jgi:chemotaxis protein methyltransferase CheR
LTILPEQQNLTESGDEENPAAELTPPAGPFVAADFSDQDYDRIGRILKEQQDFILDGYKDLCIKRRIAARIRALGLPAADAYIDNLQNNPAEQETLLATLTIHVSHFFRNPSTFAVLERQVLPELLQRARQSKSKVRVWSVGCSSGEEPYSVALLCRELMREKDLLSIIATDLSSEILQTAKQGRFLASRLMEIPAETLKASFYQDGEFFRLQESIRRTVRFFRHDILIDPPFYRADLILCRNVLIYFSREQQQKILCKLAETLLPGGYLVLGRAETLMPACRELFRCIDPAERIYQRLGDEELRLAQTVPN